MFVGGGVDYHINVSKANIFIMKLILGLLNMDSALHVNYNFWVLKGPENLEKQRACSDLTQNPPFSDDLYSF